VVQQPETECVKVFRKEMRVLLDPMREVIDELQEAYGTVTLEMITEMLFKRARVLDRKGNSEGHVIKDVASYLRLTYYIPAGDLFDRAIAEGACPLALIEELLAW
jgi:hypothetical protein